MLSVLDWTASLLTAVAMILLAAKHNSGFLVAAAGSGIWVVVGVMSGLNGLIVLNGVLAAVDAYGYTKVKSRSQKGINLKLEMACNLLIYGD